jgi:hypothetical protein
VPYPTYLLTLAAVATAAALRNTSARRDGRLPG